MIRVQEAEVLLMPIHEIPGLPRWHPCSRPHAHTYTVTLILETEVAEPDAARTPAALDDVTAWARQLDRKHLNDLMPTPPTEENLAMWIHDMWKPRYPDLAAVSVSSGRGHPRIEYRPGGARPGHFLVDEERGMTVPIGWDGAPIYPDDAVVDEAGGAK